MKMLPVPEAALDGTYSTPMTPAVGPASGDYTSPLAIPATPSNGAPAPIDHGPSTQKSLYEFPYKGSKS